MMQLSLLLTSLAEQYRLIRRALALIWKSAPGWSLVSMGLALVQSLLPVAILYLTRQLVDYVSTNATVSGAGDLPRPLLTWILLLLSVALLSVLSRSLAELASQEQAFRITEAVYDLIHSQSIAVDLGYYEDPTYFDTLHLAQLETPYRPTRILDSLNQILRNSLSLAGVIILLFSFNPLLGLILFLSVLPGGILRLRYVNQTVSYEQVQASKERRAWYYHWMMVDPGHAKEVRLFHLGDLFKTRFNSLRDEIRQGRLSLTRKRVLVDFLSGSFSYIAMYGVLAIAAVITLRGAISIGDLLMIFLGYQAGVGFMQGMLNNLARLHEDSLFLRNFYRFLELQPVVQAPDSPVPIPDQIRSGIAFEGVTFKYPRHDEPALQDIQLTIAPGQVVALVGENGSGKTTLIKLLCQLYQPTSGRITLDGIDLRTVDPIRWRRQISVVFQDFVHFNLSALENVWFGDVDNPPELSQVSQAAAYSGADTLIHGLPNGYQSNLGTWFEDGQELSAGEWQKIALARAFFRDASIVVLDEPSSALDPLAEAELFSKFRQLIGDRTAILVSHRFSTVRMADRICVFNQGRIIESGSHAELLEQQGHYARMFRTQARLYQLPVQEDLLDPYL
jgi:ATP-binding cassette, subfamily B, bacterial